MYHRQDGQESVSFTGGVNNCHHGKLSRKLSEDVPRRRVGRKIPLRNVSSGARHLPGTIRKIERESLKKPSPNPNLNGGKSKCHDLGNLYRIFE